MSSSQQMSTPLGKRLDEFTDSLNNLEDKISRAPEQIKLSYYRELDGLEIRLEELRELTTRAEKDRSSAAAKIVQQELADFESALKDAYLRFTDSTLTGEASDAP